MAYNETNNVFFSLPFFSAKKRKICNAKNAKKLCGGACRWQCNFKNHWVGWSKKQHFLKFISKTKFSHWFWLDGLENAKKSILSLFLWPPICLWSLLSNFANSAFTRSTVTSKKFWKIHYFCLDFAHKIRIKLVHLRIIFSNWLLMTWSHFLVLEVVFLGCAHGLRTHIYQKGPEPKFFWVWLNIVTFPDSCCMFGKKFN